MPVLTRSTCEQPAVVPRFSKDAAAYIEQVFSADPAELMVEGLIAAVAGTQRPTSPQFGTRLVGVLMKRFYDCRDRRLASASELGGMAPAVQGDHEVDAWGSTGST